MLDVKTYLFYFVICFLFSVVDAKAEVLNLKSPNGNIDLELSFTDKIYYSVYFHGNKILKNCTLSMSLSDEVLGVNPEVVSIKRKTVDEMKYPHIAIKQSEVHNYSNDIVVKLKGKYSVEFKAFNEGIAYRLILDKNKEIEVIDEDFTVNFVDNCLAHMSLTSGFKTSYENPYTHKNTSEYAITDEMSYLPVLLENKGKYSILISEADLSDYPCMFLKSTGDNGLYSTFPKYPLEFGDDGDRSLKILKEADYIAKTFGKRAFPWRFFVISEDDSDILENNMVYNLSSPTEIRDISWIKPGQVCWEWWSGSTPYGEDVDFISGTNTETYKYYIDFSAKYNIPYVLLDEGWASDTRNPYKPNPDVNINEIIQYGKEKGVGVILWLTWLTVENNFDLFKTFSDWGVVGVKIDFMDRSDQWMVNFYERVAKEAAKYHLFVDFHGSFKPAGLEYRYPNVLSYEGVRGMEQMGGCYPDNTLYLPFIRNAVGPMDYTPGAMLSMQPEYYQSNRPNSASIGTRSYQMALYVVFESAIQMLADNPSLYYKNVDCTEFIASVPVTWDETQVLDAKIGEYVLLARRKGDKWFIGAICNGKEKIRNLKLSLDFLDKERTYNMVYFEDGVNAGRQAMDYRKKEMNVKSNDVLDIRLSRNGGWAAVID